MNIEAKIQALAKRVSKLEDIVRVDPYRYNPPEMRRRLWDKHGFRVSGWCNHLNARGEQISKSTVEFILANRKRQRGAKGNRIHELFIEWGMIDPDNESTQGDSNE